MKEIIPHNTDKDGNAACIKANYFKMGGANFLGHPNDGLKATCVIEVYRNNGNLRTISEQGSEGQSCEAQP